MRRTAIRSVTLPINVPKRVYPRPPRWWSRYEAELDPFRRCVIAKHGPPT
jgi:hypothetical protein